MKTERERLIVELVNFKKLILENNTEILQTKYGYRKDVENEYSNGQEYIKEVLNKVNLEDINWFKDIGYYKVKVDNLNSTVGYEINIDSENVYLKYDFDSGSEEITETLYPSEYFIEFTYFWKFEWKNNQFKFIELIVAG